jgi:hypothetical protein
MQGLLRIGKAASKRPEVIFARVIALPKLLKVSKAGSWDGSFWVFVFPAFLTFPKFMGEGGR